MKKLHLILYLLLFIWILPSLFTDFIYAQELRINYINTDNFPVVEAGFSAFTKENAKIFNSTIQDFQISENKDKCKVLEVINPNQQFQKISLVIMVDISYSMAGPRIELVKEGLKDMINQLPLESSEVAIACFSDEVYIYTDFTQNRTRLTMAVNKIHAVNGTDFNKAFLHPEIGALALTKNATHKKVILFVTDGLGVTNTDQVTQMAKDMDASIFSINVQLNIPQDLKAVCEHTDGLSFEKIVTPIQFRNVNASIFQRLKCTDSGLVRWQSELNCSPDRDVDMVYRSKPFEFNYNVPENKVGKIDINPSLIHFGPGKKGLEQYQKVNITARNIPIHLNKIRIDSGKTFYIADSLKFPFQLNPENPFKLKVMFNPPDAGIYGNILQLTSHECPQINVNLIAGEDEQVKLIFPKGGETFVVDADSSVLWEGVKRSQEVQVSMKLHPQDGWTRLGKANNLKYPWHLPQDTSRYASLKITPVKAPEENMEISAIIHNEETQLKNLNYSPNGKFIITNDHDAFVKIWSAESGQIKHSLGGFEVSQSSFLQDSENLLLVMGSDLYLWNLSTAKMMNRISRISKRVSTTTLFPSGINQLVAANLSSDPAGNVRIWSPLNSKKIFMVGEPGLKWASFSADSKYAVALDDKNNIRVILTDSARIIQTIPFREPINEIVLSPSGYKAIVKVPGALCMIDFSLGKELYRIPKADLRNFSPGGDALVVKNTNIARSEYLLDTETGQNLINSKDYDSYRFSDTLHYVMLIKQDTFRVMDLQNRKLLFTLQGKNFRSVIFTPDASRIYGITNGNILEIYETLTGNLIISKGGFSNLIRQIAVNPSSKQFAILVDDNRIEIWSPGKPKDMKEAVSGFFRIVAPRPQVLDTILFEPQPLHQTADLNVDKFISNPTPYSLQVRDILIKGKDSLSFQVSNRIFPRFIEGKTSYSEEFRFNPDKTGIISANAYTITATDTFKTILIGKGINPLLKIILKHCDFGKVKVGEHKDTLLAILVNEASDSIRPGIILNAGPDDEQFILPIQTLKNLGPGDTLKLQLRFAPVWRGKTSTLLRSDLLPVADKVILQGEGMAPREVWLSGITRNSMDSLPLQARVLVNDLGAQLKITELISDTQGRFKIKLQADRNYSISAEKENFISSSIHIDLSQFVPEDTIHQDLYLTEIKPGATIRLNCIFFEFDKATLLPDSETDLKRMLDIIQENPGRFFEIQGHTDSDGSDAYNLELSKARATAVLNYLIRNGVRKDKINIRYFGEKMPVAENSTVKGKALNRRVEMKIVK